MDSQRKDYYQNPMIINDDMSAEDSSQPRLSDTPSSRKDLSSDAIEDSNSLVRKLARITEESRKRSSLKTEEERQAAEERLKTETRRIRDMKRRYAANTTVQKRLSAIEQDLERLENQGFFVSYPIHPENEFPTLLTRLPIFRPTRRRHQHRLQDIDNALAFSTPFGDGKRHGPPLTVRDEDTLIALMRLRSRRIYGRPEQLPVQIANIYATKTGQVGVHHTLCSIDDIVRQLGLTDGGENYKRTFNSVKRLGATNLELNLKTHDRYLGFVQTGRMLPLIHVQWQVYERDGLLVVFFPPVIAQWLDKEYTYIDWKTRLQLDDLGKCLHRFLSGQPKKYKTEILKLADTIGYDGPIKNIKQRLRKSLDQLQMLDWLKKHKFTGNGRSVPLVLHIER